MIHYNIWFSFRGGVDEADGLDIIRAFLSELYGAGGVAGFQLLKNSGDPTKTRMLPFQALIEFRDEAQFSAAFSAQAAAGIHSGAHGRVMSVVGDFRIEVFKQIDSMINSVIHHIGIGVARPATAEAFFDALLVEFLGLTKEVCSEAAAGWKGRGSRIYLYPIEAGSGRGAPQHLAFSARSRAEVDRFASWARERSIEVLEGPEECPEYGGDYYAIFFCGPDELKLELVHLTEADQASPL